MQIDTHTHRTYTRTHMHTHIHTHTQTIYIHIYIYIYILLDLERKREKNTLSYNFIFFNTRQFLLFTTKTHFLFSWHRITSLISSQGCLTSCLSTSVMLIAVRFSATQSTKNMAVIRRLQIKPPEKAMRIEQTYWWPFQVKWKETTLTRI